MTGAEFPVRAKVSVNAAGPWVDAVRLLQGEGEKPRLHLTKGIHLILPRERLNVSRIVVMNAPDKRPVFVVPRGNIVYLGTTDTDYEGRFDDPAITLADANYLLESANNTFSVEPTRPRRRGRRMGRGPAAAAPGRQEAVRNLAQGRNHGGTDRPHLHRRRQADHLPQDGRAHRRHGRAALHRARRAVAREDRRQRHRSPERRRYRRRHRGVHHPLDAPLAAGPRRHRRSTGHPLRQPRRTHGRGHGERSGAGATLRPRVAVDPRRGRVHGARGDGDDAGGRSRTPHPAVPVGPRTTASPSRRRWRG